MALLSFLGRPATRFFDNANGAWVSRQSIVYTAVWYAINVMLKIFSIRRSFTTGVIVLGLFAAGIWLGLRLWPTINLPFHNPWGVAGYFVNMQYNPATTLARFLVLIGLPLGLLLAAWPWLRRRYSPTLTTEFEPNPTQRRTSRWFYVFLVGALMVAVLVRLEPIGPGVIRGHDTFHDGESLGTLVSYEAGKAPYRDFLFVHGFIQDPLRTVAAFALFGRHITAMHTMEILLDVVCSVLMYGFIFYLFKPYYLPAALVSVVVVWLNSVPFENGFLVASGGMPSRDITTLLFLLVTLGLYRAWRQERLGQWKLLTLTFLWGLLGAGSFIYSIDRGYYILATYVVLVLSLFFAGFYGKRGARAFIGGNVAGVATAVAVMAVAFRGGLFSFIHYTFFTMPQYKELTDGIPFDISNPTFTWTLILVAANVFWLGTRFLATVNREPGLKLGLKQFVKHYYVELMLALISVTFVRSALGRADVGHIAYVILPSYLFSMYIIAKHYLYRLWQWPRLSRIAATLVAVGGLVWIVQTGQLVYAKGLSTFYTTTVSDDSLIPPDYLPAVRYLRAHLGKTGSFVTLTSEGSWYYYLDRPSPTRFPVVWFAEPPFYQQQMINQMELTKPKYVLYRNNAEAFHIDGVTNEERIPMVYQYVRQHYAPDVTLSGQEIWRRVR